MGDLLSAASLLLAIVSVIYGLWYNEIVTATETRVPPHIEDREAPRLVVHHVLIARAVPVTVGACLVAMVFLPDVVEIFAKSVKLLVTRGGTANLAYDAVATSLCLVEVFAITLAIHTVRLCVELRQKENLLR